ncbi:MAG: hypothetical protein AAGG72_03260, partial [Pseudomonadota bacterium]
PRVADDTGAFRFPVQSVIWDRADFRGLAGTVSSGSIGVGGEIRDAGSGQAAKIARIVTMDGDLDVARRGQAVVLQLDRDLDIARGAVLDAGGNYDRGQHDQGDGARALDQFKAKLVWLSENAFDANGSYLLRTATDLVRISGLDVEALLDLETLDGVPSDYKCQMNDIAVASLQLARVTVLDPFADGTGLGTFMVVDALTGQSVAGGVVSEVATASFKVAPRAGGALTGAGHGAESSEDGRSILVLNEAVLRAGLCSDLGQSASDRAELKRRAYEVRDLLQSTDLSVYVEIDQE